MPHFTLEDLRDCQYKTNQIRNMSVIAHVDHGKSTLTDSLLARAGLIAEDQAGDKRATDNRKDEEERGITIKSTGVSLHFESDIVKPGEKRSYLINLIDSPGHIDFTAEVTAALRVTDGALVVVDYKEGVAVQTETVLRQALQERIRPTLMINKIDRAILELKVDGEAMYQNFLRVIENVNAILSTYEDVEGMGKIEIDPQAGNCAMGAALFGWGFTLTQFADKFAKKTKTSREFMMEKLWGDNYFDPKAKKWKTTDEGEDGTKLQRGFVEFIMNPIIRLCNLAMIAKLEEESDEAKELNKILKRIGVELSREERKLEGKALMKKIF